MLPAWIVLVISICIYEFTAAEPWRKEHQTYLVVFLIVEILLVVASCFIPLQAEKFSDE